MKKTQFIDLVTTIRSTRVSFVAIVVFIALGLAFSGGISWSVEHTEQAFVDSYRQGKMQTLLVTDPLGLTGEQVAKLETIDGVDAAEGCNIVYRFFRIDGVCQQAAVWQITETVDLLMNIEGELPTAVGETAVLRSWAEEHDIHVGDVIELEDGNASDYRAFRPVRAAAEWDGEELSGLSVSVEDPGYLAENTLTVTAVIDSPVYLATSPYAHGTCAANGLYVDAVFFVSEEEMPPEAFGGYTCAVLYSEELNGMNSFGEAYDERSEALAGEVRRVVDDMDLQLIGAFSASVDRLREKLDGLYDTLGIRSEEGETLYDTLDGLRQELSEKKSLSCVSETETNNSYLTADNLISIMNSMRSVLGITFLAVAVLICYSVVSRLVADSSVSMGARKALGFSQWEILRFYLLYVGMAVLQGGILGFLIGFFGIEYAFNTAFGSLFTLTSAPLSWDPKDILPAFGISLAVILSVTAAACIGRARKSAVDLLRGERQEPNRYAFLQQRKAFRRLSLLNQTVVLNLLRDKRRVAGMLIGIAGSTMLLTAGACFYLNFTTAFTKQFTDYYRFDYQICYDAASETASGEIREVLDRNGLDYAELYSSIVTLQTPDGGTNAPSILVPADTEELAEIMFFDTGTDSGTVYESGVWINDFYEYSFDAPTGSLLRVETLDGKKADLAVDAYYKFHLTTPAILIDSETYLESFGEEAAPNAFYVSSDGLAMEELDRQLQGIDGYIYIFNVYESNLSSFNSEKMLIAAVTLLFAVMAVLMALMIIINLMNVYISEKKNELIILMINGYGHRFAKRYIYQDTIVLTIVGIVIGVIAGCVLGDMTLRAVEGNAIRMIHGVNPIACAAAAIAAAGMTGLISQRALRRIDGFKLSDISMM